MAPQDTYLDDEEETCPLCIEEFDLSDKNFRPCPCGYQVCQFCFHNIKSNMNGLCPACRRPYDEKTIQYKAVTAEEQAEFRANLQKSRKKRAELQGQREVQKRESEKDARKNLVGIRVVQKNLVYVTGLTPTVKEDELLKTLRRPEFFGQYGNIQKISISNRKNQEGQNQSLGIYVTFEKKEDAQRCIQAVNGSQNGDRILKAQLGTTKYCSAWLRHEQCTNRQCMFLHELGEEEDSYTRQDLSSLNSMQTHRSGGNAGPSSRSVSRQPAQTQAQPYLPSQPMARTSSKEGSDAGEGPALPASANWARNPQQRSRRGSHATSGAASSPAVSMSLPVTTEATEDAVEVPPQEDAPGAAEAAPAEVATNTAAREAPPPEQHPADIALKEMLRILGAGELKLRPISPDNDCPPLFDPRGGEKRRAMREEERRLNGEQDEQGEPMDLSEGEPESGSLALGGEPEDRDHGREVQVFEQRRAIAQPPISRSSTDGLYGPGIASGFSQGAPGVAAALGNRTMTPQQQAYLRPQGSFTDSLPPGITPSPSSLFQGQGHSRQTSRFNFGTDTQTSAANTLKMATNPRLMAQQASNPAFHSQPAGPYYSSMPGPPPGLKSTGTPPNMFGQGGSFGSSGFGAKDNNEVLQNLIRGRTAGVGQAHDASKLDLADPSILQARIQHHQQSSAGVGSAGLFGGQASEDDYGFTPEAAFDVDNLVSDDQADDVHMTSPLDTLSQFGTPRTPSVPPGLGFNPHGHPPRMATPTRPPPGLLSLHGTPIAPAAMIFATPTPVTPLKPALAPVASPATGSPKIGRKLPAAHAGAEAKKSIKAFAVESGLSKEITSQAKGSAKGKKPVLQDEDFPALESAKPVSRTSTPVPPKVPSVKTPMVIKKTPVETPSKPAATPVVPDTHVDLDPAPKPKKADKKQNMPVLNIAAATKAAKKSNPPSAATSAVEKPDDAAFPALPTPSSALVSSPAARTGPKTLRVISTPKAETPPSVPAQASLRHNFSSLGRPDTPGSENVSDSASIISASVSASRTNSPPPTSRVGSAAVRSTTKSQQRKARKDATKKEAAAIAATAKAEPEVEIAPILGRKKKQKKEKPAAAPKESVPPAPPVSRPPSPGPTEERPVEKDGKNNSEKASTYRQAVNESISLIEPIVPRPRRKEGNASSPGEAPKPALDRPVPSPAAVYHDLVKGGLISDPEALSVLKAVSSTSHRSDQFTTAPVSTEVLADVKSFFHEEDRSTLVAGRPVRKTFEGIRYLFTPQGGCVRNLTPAEEDRYIELHANLEASCNSPAAYVHTRLETIPGFSGVATGTLSYFPQGPDLLSPDLDLLLPTVNDTAAELSRDVETSGLTQTIPPSSSAAGNAAKSGVLANFSGLSLDDVEQAFMLARKEAEKLEKSLNQVIKKNRRLLSLSSGSGGGH